MPFLGNYRFIKSFLSLNITLKWYVLKIAQQIITEIDFLLLYYFLTIILNILFFQPFIKDNFVLFCEIRSWINCSLHDILLFHHFVIYRTPAKNRYNVIMLDLSITILFIYCDRDICGLIIYYDDCGNFYSVPKLFEKLWN